MKQQIERMQLEQVRLNNDAEQSRRLQALMGFKEQFISHTFAAQVIGSSGSERSRVIYIDKVANDGVGKDMPVITSDGVVGKVLNVFRSSSQVLLIDDQTSGVGTILEQSRLQGVLEGTPERRNYPGQDHERRAGAAGRKSAHERRRRNFSEGLADWDGGKRLYMGRNLFFPFKVKPAADLGRLEEVLVITQERAERARDVAGTNSRAVDILAARLPSVPDKKPDEKVSNNKGQASANDVTVTIYPPMASATAPGAPKTSVVGGVVSGVPNSGAHARVRRPPRPPASSQHHGA